MKIKSTIQRFEEKFYRTNDCWEWFGAQNRKGYGQFWYNNKFGKAHRAAYEIYIGPIPKDMHILHKCDNPSCVNPAHLFVGNNSDNINDRKAKKRMQLGTKCGQLNGNSKLTLQQVRNIRADNRSYRKIASSYKLTHKTVSDIKHRRTWKHI